MAIGETRRASGACRREHRSWGDVLETERLQAIPRDQMTGLISFSSTICCRGLSCCPKIRREMRVPENRIIERAAKRFARAEGWVWESLHETEDTSFGWGRNHIRGRVADVVASMRRAAKIAKASRDG